ncbi:MAG: hypothetical protein V5A68_03625 [Candidatus Thermoplasmatota archaeon]
MIKFRKISDLDDMDAVILVWGLSYFVTAVIKPGLFADLNPLISTAGMCILGVLLITSVFLNVSLLYFLLSIRAIYGFVSSWTGMTKWNVPYGQGLALVSMALVEFIIASILMYKTLQSRKNPE